MMSFCVVPPSWSSVDALLLGRDDVERQQPGRRRVDRHRRVHLVERDAVHQLRHVAAVGDRHADLADLAAGELVVGVVAGLGRAGRRRPRGRSGPWRGCRGTARWTSRRWSAPRRSASSRAGRAGPGARSWRRIVRCRRHAAAARRTGAGLAAAPGARRQGPPERPRRPARAAAAPGLRRAIRTSSRPATSSSRTSSSSAGCSRGTRSSTSAAASAGWPGRSPATSATRAPTTASTSTATAIGWCRRRYARPRQLPLPGRRPLQPPLQPARRARGGRVPLPVRGRRASTSPSSPRCSPTCSRTRPTTTSPRPRACCSPAAACSPTFFLLDDESRAADRRRAQRRSPSSTPRRTSRWSSDDLPEEAVAYDEGWVRERLAAHGLERASRRATGSWCGREDATSLPGPRRR